jgi:anti-sigma B factor antagonist
MAETLSVATESRDGSSVVLCSGRLIAGVTHVLRAEVKNLIGPGRRVVLDLSGLTQMDSMGLGTIVALYVSAKSAGGRLELVNLGPKIRLLFSMANLLSLFEPAGDGTFRIP